MLISELDLYKREWLELVFTGRNKQYGAYELRSTSNNITTRALGITLAFFIAASGVVTYASTHRPVEELTKTVIVETQDFPKDPPVIEHAKKVDPPKAETKTAETAKPLATPQTVTTQQYISMKAVPDDLADQNIKALDPDVAVGQNEVKGTTNAVNVSETGAPGVSPGTGDGESVNTPFDAVEFMPQPTGGEGAWAKFLQKNLRYPAAARENDQSGKVFISFIVERDGKLSDIQILRKAGFGFDEEALRVLKMAPAWKPGIQNGKPVRVRFTIPINFQLSND